MKKLSYSLVLLFLFMLFYAPFSGAAKKTVEKAVAGKVTGQVICLYEWKTDKPYQGSKAVCPNAGHDRSLITKKGEIYILEPADDASEEVIKLVRTPDFEKKEVIVEGEIVNVYGPVKLIKVKGFRVK
jgi:hypothetical protein